MSDALEQTKHDLVAANRILAHEGILDALGHVSARNPDNPDTFLLARARSPEIVEEDDLLDLDFDGKVLDPNAPPSYNERFIHAAVYEAHPEVMAVCHNHTPDVLPFSIAKNVKLRAAIHNARLLDGGVNVWDIADEFGTETNMLVANQEQGRSLVRAMGNDPVILMRGHGCVVINKDITQLVGDCVMIAKNARVQLAAITMGDYTPLHPGESTNRPAGAQRERVNAGDRGAGNRPWEYYLHRAGLV